MKKTNLELYFPLNNESCSALLWWIRAHTSKPPQNEQKCHFSFIKHPIASVKQNSSDFSSNNPYSTCRIRWDRNCQCIIYSFSPIAYRHLNRAVSALFSARPYLQHVFVKGSKFDHYLCLKIAFTRSVKLVWSAGRKHTDTSRCVASV